MGQDDQIFPVTLKKIQSRGIAIVGATGWHCPLPKKTQKIEYFAPAPTPVEMWKTGQIFKFCPPRFFINFQSGYASDPKIHYW